uniref:Ornithine decarboxylase antizyme n=1 Tax=Rhabditophanes sp. KR3021 TaxID=114890 RepID=A0AC35U3Z4_9BILA
MSSNQENISNFGQQDQNAPDVLNIDQEPSLLLALDKAESLVKNLYESWRCQIVGNKNFAIFIDNNDAIWNVSRAGFIKLLDHLETSIPSTTHIMMCFNKFKTFDLLAGVPRALHCIGFKTVHPDNYPLEIDSSEYLVMVLKI